MIVKLVGRVLRVALGRSWQLCAVFNVFQMVVGCVLLEIRFVKCCFLDDRSFATTRFLCSLYSFHKSSDLDLKSLLWRRLRLLMA